MVKTKKRVSKKTKGQVWDLTDIIPKGGFEKLYKLVQKDLNQFVQIRTKLTPSMSEKEFAKIIIFTE